jgi:hypothetical protein
MNNLSPLIHVLFNTQIPWLRDPESLNSIFNQAIPLCVKSKHYDHFQSLYIFLTRAIHPEIDNPVHCQRAWHALTQRGLDLRSYLEGILEEIQHAQSFIPQNFRYADADADPARAPLIVLQSSRFKKPY